MRALLSSLLALLVLATAWAADARAIVLDGKVVPGLQYVLVDGEPWFPLSQLAAAAHVEIKDDGKGTISARGFTFKGKRIGGAFLFPRADVKRALGVTVFLEKGRAMVVTEAGREKVGLVGVASPRAGGPAGASGSVPILVYGVEIDRTTSQMMRVRASVRNDSGQVLTGVGVTFALWVQGEGEKTNALTGERVGQGTLYSEYPQTLGDMQPGEVKRFEAVTSVLNPVHIDTAAHLVKLDVRDLKFGFSATAANAGSLGQSQQGGLKSGEGQQIAIEGVSLDLEKRLDSGGPRLLIVRGMVRNLTDRALSGTLAVHFWEDGAPTRRAGVTGDTVARGQEHSSYQMPFGPVAAGALEKFEIRTTIAEPHSTDAIDRTLVIEQALGTTTKATRLRFGFTAN